MQLNPNKSTDSSIRGEDNSHIQNVVVDLGGVTILAIICFGIVIAACGVVMGMNIVKMQTLQAAYENDQREWRFAELKYDELNLVMRRAGIMLPDDARFGVGGNLAKESFPKPKESK